MAAEMSSINPQPIQATSHPKVGEPVLHEVSKSGQTLRHIIETRTVGTEATEPEVFLALVVFELPEGCTATQCSLPTAVIPVTIGVTLKEDFIQAVRDAANSINIETRYPSYAPVTCPTLHLSTSIEPTEVDIAILWHLFPQGQGLDQRSFTKVIGKQPERVMGVKNDMFGTTYLNAMDNKAFWTSIKKMQTREHHGFGQDYFSCEVNWTLHFTDYTDGMRTMVTTVPPVGHQHLAAAPAAPASSAPQRNLNSSGSNSTTGSSDDYMTSEQDEEEETPRPTRSAASKAETPVRILKSQNRGQLHPGATAAGTPKAKGNAERDNSGHLSAMFGKPSAPGTSRMPKPNNLVVRPATSGPPTGSILESQSASSQDQEEDVFAPRHNARFRNYAATQSQSVSRHDLATFADPGASPKKYYEYTSKDGGAPLR